MRKLSEEEMFKIHFQNDVTEVEYSNIKFELLYNANPDCDHEIVSSPGGGIKCTKCPGWFCY